MMEIVLDSLDLTAPLPIVTDGQEHDIEVGELFGSPGATNPPSGTYFEVLDAAANLSTGPTQYSINAPLGHAYLYVKQVSTNPENSGRGDGEYLAMSKPMNSNTANNNSVLTYTETGSAPSHNVHAQALVTLRHNREIHLAYRANPGDALTVRLGIRPTT